MSPTLRTRKDPGYQIRCLPAMAPAQDPVLPRVKRTSPINRTCKEICSNVSKCISDVNKIYSINSQCEDIGDFQSQQKVTEGCLLHFPGQIKGIKPDRSQF